MSEQSDETLLQEVMNKQKALMDAYKQAGKHLSDKQFRQKYKDLEKQLDSAVGDVALQLARVREAQKLGRPLDQ